MRVTAFSPLQPETIQHALARRGVDPVHAEAAAQGVSTRVVVIDDCGAEDLEALRLAGRRHGLEVLSGDRWILLGGSIAQMGSLTRPGASVLPAEVTTLLGPALRSLAEPPKEWEMARGSVSLERPVVAGVLNVTPDSFSDGGAYLSPAAAAARADQLLEEGADLIDVGAESTRPGNDGPVTTAQEWERLRPVLADLARRHPEVPISVDTTKSEVAQRALDAGAWAINDVSGLRLDPSLANVVAEAGAGMVLMHSRGGVSDMASSRHAEYDDLVPEVVSELRTQSEVAVDRGVDRRAVLLDPGIGFAKRTDDSCRILRHLPAITALGFGVMIGPSRKRFLGELTGREPHERDGATAAACVMGYALGARVFRVHAPGPAREALDVASAIGAE